MEIVQRRDAGQAEWNRVVYSSPDAWVWATWEWQELIGRVPRWQLEDVGFGVTGGSALVAVVPLHWIAPDRRLSGSGFGLTAPTIIDAPEGQRRRYTEFIFRETNAVAERLGARRLEFALSPVSRSALANQWGVNPFVHYGFADESGHTRVLNLKASEDELLNGLSRDARQQLRKATAAGYTARSVAWPEWLDEYYRLHCETYTRTGVQPHQREYFAGIAEYLAPLGHSVLTGAFAPDGRAVAFHNTARLGSSGMYHTGCSAEEALGCGANYLVFWEALRNAKSTECEWYELGEVFPGHTNGKTFGLSVFKSKFGGDLRRSFRGALTFALDQSVPATDAKVPSNESDAPEPAAARMSAEEVTRDAYERGTLYEPSRICVRPECTGDDYTDRLLHDKLAVVDTFYTSGRVVDLCCGSGAHAIHFARRADHVVGLDFSERYVEAATQEASVKGLQNVSFVRADVQQIPFLSGSADLLYSFSALYAIANASDVIAEIARVLAPKGIAILEFGSRRSLNALSVRHYTEWPPSYPLSLGEIRAAIARGGLAIVGHRRFQLLPLWADRPSWLWPLLHPVWKRVMKRRIGGAMLDEWLCSIPLLRAFAFRHLIVCRKIA
jgi:SAM-dependent methyltransferase